ncbi:MAG: prepilin-type N-terminal cleavage/methylation domain-containing protein [Elusimicrobiaceae bacterium]|nr:prepilin-type N-terminal cleavage/methylation domain-containing protein [Elusimicrobiaceae bacterium]
MNKKAFTLIELLVVVLIIGILAAIAVPQYQVAVTKSRFTKLIISARALKDAEEVYYMENGHYTTQQSDLAFTPSMSCKVDLDQTMSLIRCASSSEHIMLQWFLNKSIYSNQRWCFAYSKVADQVCASFGGTTTFVERAENSTAARTYILP